MTAPTTLDQIRACAASMFASNDAVSGVTIRAAWGLVTVARDGECRMANAEEQRAAAGQ